ncbi:helix-turn-helix transcriptional regulator [Chryseobacterium camelliae]|uniref:Transcriptional regulator with XRE-family HTH domain n=1 Tax=Chryseobacterium camelliae TaxID=1265445 RepID=A0ABU0TI14_9FLAO|nr:helix-turn-helix transcriptional regulator [Chryseobacterium camelliae]MDQ1095778.1 transcriptional regulator with XRE-family HTH domain [Chryseobacterium camelliae]
MLKSKLHEVRIRKGLSQEQVAHLVGMTQSNYSRKERGTTKIFKREWILLAKKLEVTLEDIYEEELIIVINTDKQSSQKNDFETVDVKIPQIFNRLHRNAKGKEQTVRRRK